MALSRVREGRRRPWLAILPVVAVVAGVAAATPAEVLFAPQTDRCQRFLSGLTGARG